MSLNFNLISEYKLSVILVINEFRTQTSLMHELQVKRIVNIKIMLYDQFIISCRHS
jgi:hypothetical protein